MSNEGSFFSGFGRPRAAQEAAPPLWDGASAYPRATPAEKKAQGTPAPQADPPTVAWSGDTQLAATTPTP